MEKIKNEPYFKWSNKMAGEDKIGTTQPYDDALLITLRIGDYDVKRVMVAVLPRLCTLTSTRG